MAEVDAVAPSPVGAAVVAPQFSHAAHEGAVGEAHHPPSPLASDKPAPPSYPPPAVVVVRSVEGAPGGPNAHGGEGGQHPIAPAAGGAAGGAAAPPPAVPPSPAANRTPRSAPPAHPFPPMLQPGAEGAPAAGGAGPVVRTPPSKEELARITAENMAAAKRAGGVGDFFLKAAQWGLQAVGSRTASPDSPEVHNMFFRLARIEAELEELRNTAVHYYNVRRVQHADRIKFNNNIAACGSHSKLGNTQASEVVRHFAAAAHKLEAYADDLDRAFNALVLGPINSLLIGEIRTAGQIKKQYESMHLEYDARVTKYNEWKEDPKVPETAKRAAARKSAKAELDRASSLFDNSKDQMKIIFGVIETKRNAIFNESLASYMKSELVAANNAIGTLEIHTTAVSNFPAAEAAASQPPRQSTPPAGGAGPLSPQGIIAPDVKLPAGPPGGAMVSASGIEFSAAAVASASASAAIAPSASAPASASASASPAAAASTPPYFAHEKQPEALSPSASASAVAVGHHAGHEPGSGSGSGDVR